MKRVLVLVLAAMLGACASKKKAEDNAVNSEKALTFEQGLRALEREDYSEAARIFDRLLVQNPATELDLVVLFDSGSAYEGLGDCGKASERYRQVVRSSMGKFQRIEAEALFRTSLMYECLGQDIKAVTSLLDARKRGKDLPFDVLNAEIPARLAAAYARIGNREKALQYFTQASRGLKRVVAQTGRGLQNERVAHNLFLMGRLSPSQRDATVEPGTYLQSLSMQQPYLLQAVEINHPVWSPRAAEDLKLAYDNIWKLKITDTSQKREVFTRALQTINELRRIRIPTNTNPRIQNIFASLDHTQTQLQNELSRMGEATPLTSEAEKREGLRREGRLADPGAGKKKKAAVKK
jgi:tetratricopeptide (TPR) repeat protein